MYYVKFWLWSSIFHTKDLQVQALQHHSFGYERKPFILVFSFLFFSLNLVWLAMASLNCFLVFNFGHGNHNPKFLLLVGNIKRGTNFKRLLSRTLSHEGTNKKVKIDPRWCSCIITYLVLFLILLYYNLYQNGHQMISGLIKKVQSFIISKC